MRFMPSLRVFIGQVLVGETGIAAGRRQLARTQDGGRGAAPATRLASECQMPV